MILATLCYVQKDGKTLMLHRNRRKGDIHLGKWNGLGGKVNPGETPEECVIREVHEESGLTIKNPRLRGVLTFPKFKNEEDWYAYVYTADEFEGELVPENEEGSVEWIADGRLPELPLWEGDPFFLQWIREGRFFSGKFCYRDGKLLSHAVVFHEREATRP